MRESSSALVEFLDSAGEAEIIRYIARDKSLLTHTLPGRSTVLHKAAERRMPLLTYYIMKETASECWNLSNANRETPRYIAKMHLKVEVFLVFYCFFIKAGNVDCYSISDWILRFPSQMNYFYSKFPETKFLALKLKPEDPDDPKLSLFMQREDARLQEILHPKPLADHLLEWVSFFSTGGNESRGVVVASIHNRETDSLLPRNQPVLSSGGFVSDAPPETQDEVMEEQMPTGEGVANNSLHFRRPTR